MCDAVAWIEGGYEIRGAFRPPNDHAPTGLFQFKSGGHPIDCPCESPDEFEFWTESAVATKWTAAHVPGDVAASESLGDADA
jgi:hypothetical protein